MRVRLVGVPPDLVREARLDDAEVTAFVVVTASDTPAHLEVRPFAGQIPPAAWGDATLDEDGKLRGLPAAFASAGDGWILVRFDVTGAPALLPADLAVTGQDVIAYLPGRASQLDGFSPQEQSKKLGQALRAGLMQYARYLRTRDRSGGDATLRAMLSVKLRVGDRPADDVLDRLDANGWTAEDVAALTKPVDPAEGIYTIRDEQVLFLELKVLKPTTLRLFVGLASCCDDGNVNAVWPQGDCPTFDNGTTTYLGLDRFKPMVLPRRGDQAASYYTLKLIGYTARPTSPPIDLGGLEQTDAVQTVFATALKAPDRGAPSAIPRTRPELPAAYTWDVRIRVTAP